MSEERAIAEVFHPGEFVRDEMKERGWSMETLVEKSLLKRERLEEIIAGHCRVTPVAAHGLSLAFGTDRDVWLNLQKAWDART